MINWFLFFLHRILAHRHIGETNMNLYSSRSHTIFRMVRSNSPPTDFVCFLRSFSLYSLLIRLLRVEIGLGMRIVATHVMLYVYRFWYVIQCIVFPFIFMVVMLLSVVVMVISMDVFFFSRIWWTLLVLNGRQKLEQKVFGSKRVHT